MKLFNTLTRKKEEFVPIAGPKVGIYTCGPTVYDSAHIGNLRTYVFGDVLKRTLQFVGFDVKHVMNVTDVDDKTIKRGEGKKDKYQECVKKYEKLFFEDCAELNILPPDVVTRPTEYIDKIVRFIEELIVKGYAYKAEDGSIYFSIDKFKNYGQLSALDRNGIQAGARVNQDEYDKENPSDFALWKAWDEKDGEIFWETSIGKGRPGWHIECSTMATDVLGPTIDIHAGAVDLIFPHHENEIAQSEAKTGKKFVKYWLHAEHLLVDNKKMSKSLNNFYTLSSIKEKNFDPLDFRYLVFGSHYRSKLNFTWEGLEAARNARERLLRLLSTTEQGKISGDYLTRFKKNISDDLDTPGALAVIWEMMRDNKLSSGDKKVTFDEMNKVFGLDLESKESAPADVIALAENRAAARAQKDFSSSDELRVKIAALGWEVEDLPGGSYKIIRK